MKKIIYKIKKCNSLDPDYNPRLVVGDIAVCLPESFIERKYYEYDGNSSCLYGFGYESGKVFRVSAITEAGNEEDSHDIYWPTNYTEDENSLGIRSFAVRKASELEIKKFYEENSIQI